MRDAVTIFRGVLGGECAEEATVWLRAHDGDDADSSTATIAELYARLEGFDAPKESIGFDDASAS